MAELIGAELVEIVRAEVESEPSLEVFQILDYVWFSQSCNFGYL